MKPTELPESVLSELKTFQDFLKVMFIEHAEIKDRASYKALRVALKPFASKSWFREIKERIQAQNKVLKKGVQNKRKVNKTSPEQIRDRVPRLEQPHLPFYQPGWPELARCTASMERARTALARSFLLGMRLSGVLLDDGSNPAKA